MIPADTKSGGWTNNENATGIRPGFTVDAGTNWQDGTPTFWQDGDYRAHSTQTWPRRLGGRDRISASTTRSALKAALLSCRISAWIRFASVTQISRDPRRHCCGAERRIYTQQWLPVPMQDNPSASLSNTVYQNGSVAAPVVGGPRSSIAAYGGRGRLQLLHR